MKKLYNFVKTYIYELLALIFNVAVALITFLYITQLIAIIITVFLLAFSTFIIIYLRTKEKEFYFLPMDRPGAKKDWVGIGKFDYVISENCFEITDSHVGYIFPPVLSWSDYRFEFNFKIINSALAWIVRSNNLSNYLMFQCNLDGINPHIRLNGQWIIKSHSDADVNLTFDNKLSPDTWYRVKIICEKRNVRIIIYDEKKAIFDRHWKIPSQLSISYKISPDPKDKRMSDPIVQNIDFDFGAIGFRDHGEERGIFKNIYLEKL